MKVTRVEIPFGEYRLRRERDGKGVSGNFLNAILRKGNHTDSIPGEVVVGYRVHTGSSSYYWMTTPVAEILETSEDGSWLKFKTKNSTYELAVHPYIAAES